MIRLLIADDNPVVHEGVRRIVEDCTDIEVVGDVINVDDLLAAAGATDADVLLLEISMCGPGFLRVMERLRAARTGLQVLVLSVYPEDEYALPALRAGAAGYITKESSGAELADAIRRAHGDGRYVSPTLANRLALELDPAAHRAPHEALSEREHQVLGLLGCGRSVREIAEELGLSPKTVSTYRGRILGKLKLKTTADLIRYAVRQHVTSS